MLSTPYELQTEIQLRWMTLSEILLEAIEQEAQREE